MWSTPLKLLHQFKNESFAPNMWWRIPIICTGGEDANPSADDDRSIMPAALLKLTAATSAKHGAVLARAVRLLS